MTSGWVLRKVKQNDKWVRRWLEVNRHVLYSYQACPAESPQARVINMLDLRKTREIKLVAAASRASSASCRSRPTASTRAT